MRDSGHWVIRQVFKILVGGTGTGQDKPVKCAACQIVGNTERNNKAEKAGHIVWGETVTFHRRREGSV